MSKPVKRVLLGLATVLILVIAAISWALYPQISNLESDIRYTTADVIRDLDVYVAAHRGEWPKSWKDLGDGSDRSAYTRFRFELSAESILRRPELIYEAVTPVHGRYHTYPHAKSQLQEVLKKIKDNAGS